MHRQLAAALLAGTVCGGTLMTATPALADFPTIDITVNGAIKAMQTAMTNAISNMTSAVTRDYDNLVGNLNNPHSTTTVLEKGFTQNANYTKAQVGAESQLMDAQNASMAAYMKQQEDQRIRDDHLPSPEFCATLDSSQSMVAASAASWKVARSIGAVTDLRGEAGPGSPSFYGRAQGVQASNNMHLTRYCSADDLNDGLCTALSANQNGDQRASSLFGTDTYGDGGIEAANDYVTNAVQPVAPADLRGETVKTTAGQQAWADRRSYNARMSLARGLMNFIIGMQSPAVTLTTDQQAQMQAEGQTPVAKASWLQAISLEVDRRSSGVTWNALLQNMPPASVSREIAVELAMANYLAMQQYRLNLYSAAVQAATLAQHTDESFKNRQPMGSPVMASN